MVSPQSSRRPSYVSIIESIYCINLIVDYHDVFYDKELDGNVDLIRTGGIDLKLSF